MTVHDFFPKVDRVNGLQLLLAAAGFACVAVASLLSRIAGDTLFLGAYGRDSLAFAYLGTAVVACLLSYLFGISATRLRLNHLIAVSAALLALLALVIRFALGTGFEPMRYGAYLLADLMVHGNMLLFWTYFGGQFDARQAKGFIGPVGAVGTLGCLGAASAVGPFNAAFGVEDLLTVAGLLTGVFGALVFASTRTGNDAAPVGRASVPTGGWAGLRYHLRLFRAPNIRDLALLAGASTIAVTLVDYQFKVVAQQAYPAERLPEFFGNFYLAANIVVLVIQVLLVKWVLSRGGLPLSLSLLPTALVACSIGVLFGNQLTWSIAGRFAIQTLVFTVNIAAVHVLYLGVKRQSYAQARALADGICKPAAIGLTGAILFLSSAWITLSGMAIAAILLAGLWMFLARRNYRTYLAALVEGLRAKLLYPTEQFEADPDPSLKSFAKERLLSAPPEDLPYLFTLLDEFEDVDLTAEMRILLRRDHPEVKVAALQRMRGEIGAEDLQAVLEHRNHPAAQVRRAAILTVSSMGGEAVLDSLIAALQDEDPTVKAEAAAALIQLGDLDGLIKGVQTIKELMESAQPADRTAVAGPLGQIQLTGSERLLVRLLEDSDLRVVETALGVCRLFPTPELVAAAVPLVSRPSLSGSATDVLVAGGAETLRYLSAKSDQELAQLFEQSPIMSIVLVRVGGSDSLQLLRRVMGCSQLTPALFDGYRRLLGQQASLGPFRAEVEQFVVDELRQLEECRVIKATVNSTPYSAFLDSALAAVEADHVQNLFFLLETVVAGVDLQVLRARLDSGRAEERSQALEVLENVLPGRLRQPVLTSLGEPALPPGNPPDPLGKILAEASIPWLLAGALYAAARNRRGDLVSAVLENLNHQNPICRETALYALFQLPKSANGVQAEAAQRLSDDDDPAVRKLARSLLAAELKGVPMITVERILFLKNVPLFSRMESADLTSVAEITKETLVTTGTEVIREGEIGNSMFLVVDGEILIHRGKTRLQVLKAKGYFGEMAILDGEPRSASATALTDCFLLSIEQRDFVDLIMQHSSIARALIGTLNQRLRDTLGLLDAREQVADLS